MIAVFLILSCEKEELRTITFEVQEFDPVSVQKTNDQTVFMHYMPWFETKESNGGSNWGYHWTMFNQDPDIIDENGRRQIASHYYPMIGPYHSGDKEVVEYHLLLMKYAGIDGVLIDWYGTFDANDYAINQENTLALVDLIDEVGLKFAIVYEDRTLQPVVDAGLAGTVENAAKADMQFLQNNFFNHPNYHYVDNQPLLLVFGPDRLKNEQSWIDVFSNISPKPKFLPLSELRDEVGAAADGEFAWIFDGNANNEIAWYENLDNIGLAMASAYPGFHDFYSEGGVGDSFFFIDHNAGNTFDSKLAQAENSNLDLVQLVTWNDFGEGTIIEPTEEFGFSYLEKVQAYMGANTQVSVFPEILELYHNRVAFEGNIKVQKKLDQAFYYFVSLQTEEAIMELDNLDQ